MPYIDLNEAIKHLRGACIAKYPLSFSYGIFASADEISKLPAADVVPRSEVEELKKAYANYEETSGLKQAKDELARTIFEEIEKEVDRGVSVILKILNGKGGRANGKTVLISKYDVFIEAKKHLAKLKEKYVTDTNAPAKVSSGDICVVCGEHVPEGRQICSMCEVGQEFLKKKE